MTERDIIIIGSGPAGYSAAIYAARGGYKPLLLTGLSTGGQMTTTTDVENYPGFADVIQGPWLMEQMKAQAENTGTEIVSDTINAVDFDKKKNNGKFKLVGDTGTEYFARAVIIATGATAKWLGLSVEEKFKGFGVSGCATCDGFFYKGEKVMVIGGGNTALEEALFLAGLDCEVVLVHRRDHFRGEQILQDRVKAHKKIQIIYDHKLVDIKGSGDEPAVVTGAVIENVKDGKQTEIPLMGIFIAIGHAPATEIFKGKLPMDDHGYLTVAAGSTRTAIDGVFAAGDVADSVYRQAVTSAGMGCMAALDAVKYLRQQS